MNILLTGDLTTCLQLAGIWLDPLTMDDALDSEEQEILVTLREHRIEQYASYLWHTYEGCSPMEVNSKVTDELNAWLPYEGEYLELQQVTWGLPITFMGAGVHDESDFWEASWGTEIARLFLLDENKRDHYVWGAHKIMRDVKRPLDESDDLSCALAWLFSSSGNTLIDMSYEEGANNGLGAGNWDGLELITDMHHEASELLGRAVNAFKLLDENNDLYGQFCGDLLRAYWQSIEEVHNVCDVYGADSAPYQRTPISNPGAASAADPEPDLYAVRDRAA